MDYFNKIAAFLEEQGEAAFGYSDKYVEIHKRADGDWDGNIYDSKNDYINNPEEVLDGGIFTGESALEAIQFFTEDLL